MAGAYDIARGFTGSHEGDAKLDAFLNGGGAGLSSTDYAWCARFVKQAAAQAGVDVSQMTDMARSALKIGTPVDSPRRGDIAVFPRGGNPSLGHVGFVESDGINPDGTVTLLSGNHADSVASDNYPASRAIGYRRIEEPPSMNGGYGLSPTGTAGISGSIHTATPTAPSDLFRDTRPSTSVPPPQQGPGAFGATKLASAAQSFGNAMSDASGAFGGGGELDDRANQQALSEEEKRANDALRKVMTRNPRMRNGAFG